MTQKTFKIDAAPTLPSKEVLNSIISRVHAMAMNMIYLCNHRDDIQKGDPKVGGHPSASSSALHLLSTLHLMVKNPQDFIACKPHASPTDHANNYLLRLFFEADGSKMSDERAQLAMKNLRHFSKKGEPVFQSYHSAFDPDYWNYLPSGSVGIPPVNAAYLAHAYRMAETQGFQIPSDAQFWCIMGDSEYREGSLAEVLPEISERGLGNVTWIVDYNRQSLDGHRILNEEAQGGKDNDRIEKTTLANGWDVIQLRHGSFRQKIFQANSAGEALMNVLEKAIPDYEFNALLAKHSAATTIEALAKYDQAAASALKSLTEEQVKTFMYDLGGHDIELLKNTFEQSKLDRDTPVMILAHTVKGWGLEMAAKSANHSAMLTEEEVHDLRAKSGIKSKDLYNFERFEKDSKEGQYLAARGEYTLKGIQACKALREENKKHIKNLVSETKAFDSYPAHTDINLKMLPMAHTQWMLGQIAAKLTRVADTSLIDSEVTAPAKPLSAQEKKFKTISEILISMAPDVGTSTNLNASMDGKIYGTETEDFETEYGVKDTKAPDIVPHVANSSRYVRFDIAEGNTMSCMGSYGKMGELAGVPFIPLMTVYDFFIKRALDQLFYNAYWNSSFICVGTPAGITLSPEGAQHAWKSDIQIANCITWEPAYALELDWIFTDACKRHLVSFLEGPNAEGGNTGRTGVIIRGVTRALDQKEMLRRLSQHKRFQGKTSDEILELTRLDCLEGAYYLVDHRGTAGYRPSENVVHLFAMGALITEALAASDELLKEGIFANVIQVSSPDLLLGNLADKNDYNHLRQGLGISGDLHLKVSKDAVAKKSNDKSSYPPALFAPSPISHLQNNAAGMVQLLTLGGRRIPIVSVHDGEPGLLDNIGSIVGTLHKTLAVRRHSKSGRPVDVFEYHSVDAGSVAKAAKKILNDSAYTGITLDAELAQQPSIIPTA